MKAVKFEINSEGKAARARSHVATKTGSLGPARTAEEISCAIYSAREGFTRDDALRAFAGVKRKER